MGKLLAFGKMARWAHFALYGALFGVGFGLLPVSQVAAKQVFISIGTGGQTGVYFIAGSEICQLMNRAAAKIEGGDGVRCNAPSTGGSIYNLNALRSKDLDFGIAQSDWQYHAYRGTDKFEGQKFGDLRSVFSLHSEPFQILVGKNSGIKSWADLKGKRVNIGNAGSGQRGTFETLMKAYGVDKSYFGLATEMNSTEQAGALCNGNIDAFGYSVGFPNAGVAQATDGCEARIISLDGAPVKKLVEEFSYFDFTRIPTGTYSTVKDDVITFGVKATLVTRADLSEEVVYGLVKAVFEGLEDFKKYHPVFRNFEPKEMISDALTAPLHPGAEKYYKERGWLK